MNSFCLKIQNRRWTDGNTENEIDLSISDKKYVVQNVTVLNQMNVGSISSNGESKNKSEPRPRKILINKH